MFFRWYINEHTMVDVLVLGPEEYERRQTIKCVTTVLNLWFRILAEFDSTVVARMRQKERDPKARSRLRLIQQSYKGNVASKTYLIKLVRERVEIAWKQLTL